MNRVNKKGKYHKKAHYWRVKRVSTTKKAKEECY